MKKSIIVILTLIYSFLDANMLFAVDTTPDSFNFTDRTNAALNKAYKSNAITVAGIDTVTPISIVSGTYSINGAAFTNASGTVNIGNTIKVRKFSAATYSTTEIATLTIGTLSETFSVTTLIDSADTTPDPFTFTDRTNVALSTEYKSNTIRVSGITTATPISITGGGTYSINGGAYTSAIGTVVNGSTVKLKIYSSTLPATTKISTLIIGGISGVFSVTTQAAAYATEALRIADFILLLQNTDGAIVDELDGDIVNEDSNMEYGLVGLAAAYQQSGDLRYLTGLEKGIRWLADREDMGTGQWRGSWRYAYAYLPPYNPVAIPLGDGVTDARGVDATSALFAYVLHLHTRLSGSTALAEEYETHARAALDFVLDHNQAPNGFFYSSWQQKNGQWQLWKFQYTADQADVYLGMQAGWLLYGDIRYQTAANHIAANISSAFFLPNLKRYSLGLDEYGTPDYDTEGFNGIFAQGYVPWIFGNSANNHAAFQWLTACQQPNGSLSCFSGDPLYSLSAAIYALPATILSQPIPTSALSWIINTTYKTDGGVVDTVTANQAKYSNVAGFTIASMLQYPAF